MTIGHRAASFAAATSALAGLVLFAVPAHAAPPLVAAKSVQNFADDTNLDAYDGNQVWTRDSSLGYQVWLFNQVETTPEGTGVYTISSTTFPNTCIQDAGTGAPVTQQPCDRNKLSQRWVVDFGQEQTTIASYKNLDEVLQGNGVDTPVTLVPANKAPNQIWSLYDK
ncbi:RICIN domain-containing protein [Kitasatospora sp. NBC_01302]|uniref:RICIN domain-containing protein n=1 Tax=Kitasatospora sp. NBC_01302 TaxID=2903575 RepID=UPI002E0DF278|nr:RICIN domain-containing protein [Kitasatospora sp. NBC_01302]